MTATSGSAPGNHASWPVKNVSTLNTSHNGVFQGPLQAEFHGNGGLLHRRCLVEHRYRLP